MANNLQDRADLTIRHQIELERYKAGQTSKMVAMINHVNEDVVDRLEELNEKILAGQSKAFYTQKRLQKMSANLAKIVKDGFVDIHVTATEDNRKLVDHEIEWSTDVLLSELDNLTAPTTRQVFASVAKDPFHGWVEQGKAPMTYANSSPLREVEAKYLRDMERSLKTSYLTGATVKDAQKRLDKINQNIAKTKKDYNVTLRNTEAETRTAIQTYANRAMQETLIENGIEWELFLATLDLRTTEICGTLDGTRWEIADNSRPQIPVHWNCRSVYVPLFDKNEKLEGMRPQTTPGLTYKKGDKYTSNGKIRKARRGDGSLKRSQVSTDMDLNNWLKRQDRTDPKFVLDYFGSQKKYDDWKAGKLGEIKYFGISGKRYNIGALRYSSIGDNVQGTAPSLEMRGSSPSKYFMAKGSSKPISKKLDSWAKQKDGVRKLSMENNIANAMNEGMINRRINDPKRLKYADDMLKTIEIVGEPGNADVSVEEIVKEFRKAVAMYGTRINGIKRIEFSDVVVRSNIDEGILLIDNNGSNVYKEIGRFIAHNDDAYLQGSKYFSTVDIDEVVADGFSRFRFSNEAFNLYKKDPEKFKFMMGIIDDKPKKIKVSIKPPSVSTKNQPIKPVNVDNALPAMLQKNTLEYYTKQGANAPVTRALKRFSNVQKKYEKAFEKEMKRIGETNEYKARSKFRMGEEKLSPPVRNLQDQVFEKRNAAIEKIKNLVIKSRVNKRLPKFKNIAKTELDGLSPPNSTTNNLTGKALSDAKSVSAEAMALLNQRPSTFRHLVKRGNRASANKYDEYVNIGNGGTSSIFHEIGHHVEFSNPDIKEAAQQFIDKKTTGKIVKLKDLFPGHGYEDWEKVLEDEFINPYVGKIYRDGDTEVISMGLEQFVSADKIVNFYLKDPEHFEFIFGIIKEYDKLP